MRLGPSLALLSLLLSEPVSGDGQHGLAIELRSQTVEVELGQPILLRLTFENVGNEPFYVERTKDFGPQHLSIRAQRGGCVQQTAAMHYDAEIESLRFSFMPLLPGDRLEESLPPLSGPFGPGPLDLTEPGEYSVRASFVSQGSPHAGLIWPVWRGSVTSADVRLVVSAPQPPTVAEWRDRLRSCYAQVPCEDWESVAYFRLVRDSQAREVLEHLFDRDYEANPMIAEALAHQLEPRESDLIRRIGERTGDVDLRARFLAIAERVRNRGQTTCAR